MRTNMPLIGEQTCGKCKHSRPVTNPQPGAERICKRYPPQLNSVLIGRNADGSPMFMHHCAWPPVGKDEEGCTGEWKPIIATGIN